MEIIRDYDAGIRSYQYTIETKEVMIASYSMKNNVMLKEKVATVKEGLQLGRSMGKCLCAKVIARFNTNLTVVKEVFTYVYGDPFNPHRTHALTSLDVLQSFVDAEFFRHICVPFILENKLNCFYMNEKVRWCIFG